MNFTINNYTPAKEEPAKVTKRQTCASSPTNKIQSNGLSKKTNNKPIVHPQLQEASMYTEDKFWINILLKSARGEFMTKFISYDGVYLYKRDSGIRERVSEDTKELCKAFIIFHKKHVGVHSPTDTERQKKLRKEIFQQEIKLTWDICNNEMKQARLVDYCYAKTTSKEETADMLSVVRAAQDLKLLNSNTVIMDNNIITNITTVSYNKKTNVWYVRT